MAALASRIPARVRWPALLRPSDQIWLRRQPALRSSLQRSLRRRTSLGQLWLRRSLRLRTLLQQSCPSPGQRLRPAPQSPPESHPWADLRKPRRQDRPVPPPPVAWWRAESPSACARPSCAGPCSWGCNTRNRRLLLARPFPLARPGPCLFSWGRRCGSSSLSLLPRRRSCRTWLRRGRHWRGQSGPVWRTQDEAQSCLRAC